MLFLLPAKGWNTSFQSFFLPPTRPVARTRSFCGDEQDRKKIPPIMEIVSMVFQLLYRRPPGHSRPLFSLL